MARFKPVPNLDEKVARMIAPDVRDIARRVQFEARKGAPAAKKWVSMGDGRVRDTHRAAHRLPAIPDNLRFPVPGQPWDIEHGLSPGVDYLLGPRDHSSGLPADSVQHRRGDIPDGCRCHKALQPTAIADAITLGPTKVYGTEVEVVVSCTFYKIVECEFGDSYGHGVTATGTRFMGRAASRVAGTGGYGPPGGANTSINRGGPGDGNNE